MLRALLLLSQILYFTREEDMLGFIGSFKLVECNDGKCIKVKENSALNIICTSNTDVRLDVPRSEVRDRINRLNGSEESTFQITNMKPSDTGNYSCVADDRSDSAYIFVLSDNGPTFLSNYVETEINLMEDNFLIPCKLDRPVLNETIVIEQLYQTEAAAYSYDARRGAVFKSTMVDSRLKEANHTSFLCKYKDAEATVKANLVGCRGGTVKFNADMKWPYVGLASYTLNCTLDPYSDYNISWSCPRCNREDSSIVRQHHQQPGGERVLSSSLTLHELTEEDTGQYQCILTCIAKGWNKPNIIGKLAVNVSPTKEQIRVVNATSANVTTKEGEPVQITFSAEFYPAAEYQASWYKVNGSEFGAVNPKFVRKAEGEVENGRTEELYMENCDEHCSGIYTLEVKIGQNFVKRFNWEVRVRVSNPTLSVSVDNKKGKIDYLMEDSTVFVLVGHETTVKCSINDDANGEPKLEMFSNTEGAWTNVNDTKAVIFVNRITTVWKMIPKLDTRLRCTASSLNKTKEFLIRMTGIIEPTVSKFEKNGHDMLNCSLPMDADYSVIWKKDGETKLINATVENFVKNFITDIESFQSPTGIYECSNAKYNVSLEVTSISTHKSVSYKVVLLVSLLVTLAILVIAVIGILFLLGRRSRSSMEDEKLEALLHTTKETRLQDGDLIGSPTHNERQDQLKYNPKYEIQRERIKFGKYVGGGERGSVYLCELSKSSESNSAAASDVILVAAKRPRDRNNAEHFKALAAELRIMIAVGIHPNVLCLVGAVAKHIRSHYLYVISEYCELGNLHDYLLANKSAYVDEVIYRTKDVSTNGSVIPGSGKNKGGDSYKAEDEREWDAQCEIRRQKEQFFSTSDIISFGYQVANGLEYLASKNCIHGDLATRNILITEKFMVRIADFCLARIHESSYQLERNIPLAVRWLPPETLLEKRFSKKSDVWSYGIVLWEIFTFGDLPFSDVGDASELARLLDEGLQLQRPEKAPLQIYQIMKKCTRYDAVGRPDINKCKEWMENEFKRVSPLMKGRVESQLCEDERKMQQYAEYRGEDKQSAMTTWAAAAEEAEESMKLLQIGD